MQNILFRVPALYETWVQPKVGNQTYTTFPSSSRFISRRQTGYTGKRPKKPMPPHDYMFVYEDIRMSTDYDYIDMSDNHLIGRGPCLAPNTNNGITLNPSFDSLDATLSADALSKLNDKTRGDLDISVDLAEAHKTAKMLNFTQKVVDYTKMFTRKFALLKPAANAWLEYTYGVKPLLRTLYGAADENLRVVINKTQSFTARASGVFVPTSIPINTIWGVITFPVVSSNLKRSWTYGVNIATDQFDLARWSSLNPASIAWELQPYSFVVDWFFNVGGYLRNMETYLLYNNKFRSGYRTILTTGDLNFEKRTTSLPNYKYVNDHNYGYARLVIIQRSVLNSYPVPSLPSLRARLGSSRLLSAASLLAQMLGRR